jgi:hypothetical protein
VPFVAAVSLSDDGRPLRIKLRLSPALLSRRSRCGRKATRPSQRRLLRWTGVLRGPHRRGLSSSNHSPGGRQTQRRHRVHTPGDRFSWLTFIAHQLHLMSAVQKDLCLFFSVPCRCIRSRCQGRKRRISLMGNGIPSGGARNSSANTPALRPISF